MSLGSTGPGEVWFRGDLPIRAAGSRLHHRSCRPRHRVPAEVHVWNQPKEIQRTLRFDFCKTKLIHAQQLLIGILISRRRAQPKIVTKTFTFVNISLSNTWVVLCPSSQTVLELCYLLPETNVGTLVVSIVAIVGLILLKELNAYLSKKLPIPIPVELIGVSTQQI